MHFRTLWSDLTPRGPAREFPSPSARAALRGGIPVTLYGDVVTAVGFGLICAWPGTARDGLRFGVVMGTGAAVLVFTWLGAYAAVEQTAVRWILHQADLLPMPSRPFLDHAVQCLFLRQVGDGYTFVHRSLLEFFAGATRDGEPVAERIDILASPPS